MNDAVKCPKCDQITNKVDGAALAVCRSCGGISRIVYGGLVWAGVQASEAAPYARAIGVELSYER